MRILVNVLWTIHFFILTMTMFYLSVATLNIDIELPPFNRISELRWHQHLVTFICNMLGFTSIHLLLRKNKYAFHLYVISIVSFIGHEILVSILYGMNGGLLTSITGDIIWFIFVLGCIWGVQKFSKDYCVYNKLINKD